MNTMNTININISTNTNISNNISNALKSMSSLYCPLPENYKNERAFYEMSRMFYTNSEDGMRIDATRIVEYIITASQSTEDRILIELTSLLFSKESWTKADTRKLAEDLMRSLNEMFQLNGNPHRFCYALTDVYKGPFGDENKLYLFLMHPKEVDLQIIEIE